MTDYKNELEQIREQLAAIEHERWADWQKYVHGICMDNMPELGGNLIIPTWAVENWTRQINTKYADLTEKEKKSDMEQVDRYWPLIEALLSQHSKKRELEILADVQVTTMLINKTGEEKIQDIFKYTTDRINKLGGQDE